MREEAWYIMMSLVVIVVMFVAINNKKKKSSYYNRRLPPGGRGWPLVGDSISWYNAVASSHPPRFVEQQVKRYRIPFRSADVLC